MNHTKNSNRFALIFLTVLFLLPDLLLAVPAFARRHKVSCNTCHTVFPRLKAYGEEFAGNGFIMKEDDADRNYVKTGDELLRLNRDFPLGVRMEAFASLDQTKTVESDLQSPWGLKILSGGTLARNVGYYFYFYMDERGDVAGVEDAYIHFDNLGGSELDIMVGQFQTSDPLMKRELRLTYEDYEFYKTRIGSSNTNLAYDRGVMFVYGFPDLGTDLAAFIVNGNGRAAAGADKRMDRDNYKNLGFRVMQGIGESIGVGAYYYMGKEGTGGVDNKVTYYGPDFALGMGNLDLTGQLMYRIDTNPNFLPADSEVNTTGVILEAIYGANGEASRGYVTALYNLVDSDAYRYETATLSYTYQLARNLRILAEYSYDLEAEGSRFVIGTIGGF